MSIIHYIVHFVYHVGTFRMQLWTSFPATSSSTWGRVYRSSNEVTVSFHPHVFLVCSAAERRTCSTLTVVMLKSLTRVVSVAAGLSHRAPLGSASRPAAAFIRSALCAPSSATAARPPRSFTRSMWMMCGKNSAATSRSKLLSSKHTLPSCGCGSLHTDGKRVTF